ncbi:MAG: Pla-1/cef family extracellular lipase [Alphaproteobacteria bacterium]|jgi:Pla-1/cef family extracellular lipase
MRKLVLGTSIAALLGLAGCGGETIEDLQAEATSARPASRVLFDPSNGVLPVPNNLLFTGTQDGTLEMPDEVAARENGGTPNYASPSIALGAQDGWSVQQAFVIGTSHPTGISLDAASVSTPGSVRLFRGAVGGDLNDADCTAAPPISGCKIYEELTFGVDFVSQASGNNIAIVPLKPFPGASSIYVALTDGLKGSDGQALQGSTTYGLVSLPISTQPLASEAQLGLQALINSYEAVLVRDGGVDAESIIYSATFNTQVTDDIFNTVKGLQIGAFAGALGQGASAEVAAQFLPAIPVGEALVPNVFEAIASLLLSEAELAGLTAVGLNTCSGLIAALADPAGPLFPTAAATFASAGPFCAAQMKQGSIDLPYYLSPTAPLSDSWQAACTNALALRGIGAEGIGALIAAEAVGPANDYCQAASAGMLFDLDTSSLSIIDDRHLTRYSPIPLPKGRNTDGTESLDVQVTVPDATVVAILAGLSNAVNPITKPEAGWPVVILSHGITSKKEDVLAMTAALSLAGFATVAIDHPLHGSRGFVLEDGTIVNTSAGFGGSTTDYFNLASLLSGRDNNRQAVADVMGLRLGLNALVDLTNGSVDIDGSTVYIAGQSLGAMISTVAVTMANTSLSEVNPALADFDGMYAIKAAGLNVPGGGTVGFLLESPGFGPVVKSSILGGGSADFQQFLGQYMAENGLTDVALALIPAFLEYDASATAAQQAEAESLYSSFAFAAQTMLDSGDPNTYALALNAQGTPVYMAEVVGGGTNDDGSTALPDQTIPNFVPPLSGTEALASLIGLEGVSSTTPGSGLVRFIAGGHGSLLNPSPSAATTVEMQQQIAAFFATAELGQATIVVTNQGVVAN